MRRACPVLAILLAGVVVAAAAGVALLLRGGIGTRVAPSAAETAVARWLRHHAIPAAARDRANPVPSTPEVVARARAHFADHCATCHANDGSGRTDMGASLYPRAPDLRAAATQELSDGEMFYIIEEGVRFTGMPAWGRGPDTENESWELVDFIRHLSRLTPGELQEMEQLNPRSPAEWRELEEEDSFLRGGSPAPPDGGHHAHQENRP